MQGLSWAGTQLGGMPTAVQKGCAVEQEGGGVRDSTAPWGLGLGFLGVWVPLFVGRRGGLGVRAGRGARRGSRAAGGARKEKRRRGEGGADGRGQRARKRGEEARLGLADGSKLSRCRAELADGSRGRRPMWMADGLLGRRGRRERRAERREKERGNGLLASFP
jgi:hypothetical protein